MHGTGRTGTVDASRPFALVGVLFPTPLFPTLLKAGTAESTGVPIRRSCLMPDDKRSKSTEPEQSILLVVQTEGMRSTG
jgi:hypothetical protein